MSSKISIRKKFIAIRKELSQKRHKEGSQAAVQYLIKLLSTFPSVLSFASKKEEINLWPLNKILAKEGRLLLPGITSEFMILPYQVKNLNQELILRSKWDILEPNPKLCQEISIDKIDYALIPGVAFDRAHGRLGYGKGFYDQFLTRLTCPFVGVGFKEQLLNTPFAHEDHDVPLTGIHLF